MNLLERLYYLIRGRTLLGLKFRILAVIATYFIVDFPSFKLAYQRFNDGSSKTTLEGYDSYSPIFIGVIVIILIFYLIRGNFREHRQNREERIVNKRIEMTKWEREILSKELNNPNISDTIKRALVEDFKLRNSRDD